MRATRRSATSNRLWFLRKCRTKADNMKRGAMRQVLLITVVAALLGGCGTMVTDGYRPTFDVKELYEKLERQSGGGA